MITQTSSQQRTTIADLAFGDHVCSLYANEEEHRALVTPFLRQGLERGEKVHYAVDTHTPDDILAYLRADGLDPAPFLASGQLTILFCQDFYLQNNLFHPGTLQAQVRDGITQAQAEGYAGLRLTAEMSWILGSSSNIGLLREYESRLNTVLHGQPCIALCQYDQRVFSPEALLDVLDTHPVLAAGTAIYANPDYIPPEDYLGPQRAACELRRRMDSLVKQHCAEVALGRARDHYLALLDDFPTMIWAGTNEGARTYANTTYLSFTGETPEEALAYNWVKRVHPADHERCLFTIREAARSLNAFEIEYRLQRHDGQYRWLRSIGKPFHSPDGGFVGYIGACFDITEQKWAEQASRESERRLREVLEQVDLIAVSLDPHGAVTFCNDYLLRLTGWDMHEVLGRNWFDVFIPTGDDTYEMFYTGILSGMMPVHHENDILTSTGERRTVLWSNTLLYDAGGEIVSITSLGQDITEQKQFEAALIRAKTEWEMTFDAVPDLIIISDDRHRILRANRAVVERLGVPITEIIGRSCYEVLFGRAEPIDDDPCFAPVAGDASFAMEYHLEHFGGTYHITTSVIHAENGQAVGSVHIARDITARIQADEALRSTKEMLQAVISASPLAIIALGQQGEVLTWNPAAETILGWTEPEVVGQPYPAIPPEEWASFRQYLQRILRGSPSVEFEATRLRKDGTAIEVSVSAAPLHDAAGTAIGVITVVADISARKRTERALRESEERYALVVHGIDAGVWDRDLTSDALYISPRWKAILGYDDYEIPHTVEAFYASLHPDDHHHVTFLFTEARAGRLTSANYECRLKHKDGSYRWVYGCGILVRDAEGRPSRVVGSITDITERKQAEAQVLEYQDQLRSLAADLIMAEERERRRLAEGLHDHVGQLLALSYIRLGGLRGALPESDKVEELQQIRALLKDAIDATKSLTFALSPPILYELGLTAALKWLGDQFALQHGLRITVLQEGPAPAKTDELGVLAFQLTRELLINALKHAEARTVTIHLRYSASVMQIAICDDGVGFDLDVLETRRYGRPGFGLFSIRERLRHVGGGMSITTAPGQGTTIVMTIPSVTSTH